MLALTRAFTLAAALRHPRVERDRIVDFQARRLRRLVAHAYSRVPYYRTLLDRAGVKPEDVRSLADLSLLPVTSKRDLRDLAVEDVTARGTNPGRLILRRTSGVSGEPFDIRRTWIEERILGALRHRATWSYGIRLRDRRVVVGRRQDPAPNDYQFPLTLLQLAGFFPTIPVDFRQPPETVLRMLERVQPDVLVGLTSALDRLAQALPPGQRVRIRPRYINVGGEVLTPIVRARIQDAFNAPLLDSYGSHEFNLLAWQCRETGGYHVCDDGVILEVLRDGRPAAPGEQGEVVATGLHSFAMPFLRYRLGDVVTRGADTCPCGQPFSTIGGIRGRMIDFFRLPDGRLLHPYEILTAVVLDHGWIRQYRLIQEREDRIVLQVVPSAPVSPVQLESLRAGIGQAVGPAVDVYLSLLEDIPVEPGGKVRVVQSFVHSNHDAVDWEHA